MPKNAAGWILTGEWLFPEDWRVPCRHGGHEVPTNPGVPQSAKNERIICKSLVLSVFCFSQQAKNNCMM